MKNALDQPALLIGLFHAAIEAVAAQRILPLFLPPPPKGRTLVVGAGKAAAAMAQVVECHWQGPLSGIVITRYGHGLPTKKIEVIEAAHPIPDHVGEDAAKRILEESLTLTKDDLLLCLISGGGSALLALPAPGITLADKRDVTAQLLRSGAPISAMNCLRKHLSAIKGGRLARAAWPAKVVSLLVSDVPGDDPSVIASGPTVADPTSFADARAIIDKFHITLPLHVTNFLSQETDETPKPGDPKLSGIQTIIVARPKDALAAAALQAKAAGYEVEILGDDLEGEARTLGQEHARLALQRQTSGKKQCILSGGETTVTLKNKNGRGGRNAEYLLALAIALNGAPGIIALAADTDGIDGSEDNAGAIMSLEQMSRARALGLDAEKFLAENNAYDYFAALGDLLMTGPTRTNVNDFRAILIN